MEYLARDEFDAIVVRNYGKGSAVHREAEYRWHYHSRTIETLRAANVSSPNRVLEVGTMGTQVVKGSHTLDYDEKWNFEGNQPTYLHDLRNFPWPLRDKQYDWLVAMRVFHHLYPVQRQCFEEARRVAKNVLIVVPAIPPFKSETDAGITSLQLFRWNGFKPPTLAEGVPWFGALYVWSDDAAPMPTSKFLPRALIAASKRLAKRIIRRE